MGDIMSDDLIKLYEKLKIQVIYSVSADPNGKGYFVIMERS